MNRSTTGIGGFLAFAFLNCPGYASDICADFVASTNNASVEELLKNSSYVGIYQVRDASKSDEKRADNDSHLYDYELILTKHLQGKREHTVSIWGLKPYEQIPQHYFAMLELHELVQAEGAGQFGTTGAVALKFDGSCIFAPKFMIGYSYLILGGVDSSIAYELVPITELDKWYRLVEKTSLRLAEGAL